LLGDLNDSTRPVWNLLVNYAPLYQSSTKMARYDTLNIIQVLRQAEVL
jgi:hypothetical protein